MLWRGAIKLASLLLRPPGDGSVFRVAGWDFPDCDKPKLRMMARQGALGHVRLSETPHVELAIGLLISRVSAIADVYEREMAILHERINLLQEQLDPQPEVGPMGKKLDAVLREKEAAARIARKEAMAALLKDTDRDAPMMDTPLTNLRFGGKFATEQRSAMVP